MFVAGSVASRAPMKLRLDRCSPRTAAEVTKPEPERSASTPPWHPVKTLVNLSLNNLHKKNSISSNTVQDTTISSGERLLSYHFNYENGRRLVLPMNVLVG